MSKWIFSLPSLLYLLVDLQTNLAAATQTRTEHATLSKSALRRAEPTPDPVPLDMECAVSVSDCKNIL